MTDSTTYLADLLSTTDEIEITPPAATGGRRTHGRSRCRTRAASRGEVVALRRAG